MFGGFNDCFALGWPWPVALAAHVEWPPGRRGHSIVVAIHGGEGGRRLPGRANRRRAAAVLGECGGVGLGARAAAAAGRGQLHRPGRGQRRGYRAGDGVGTQALG